MRRLLSWLVIATVLLMPATMVAAETITVYVHPQWWSSMESHATEYQMANPHVEIQLVSGMGEQVTLAALAGNLPDLFFVDSPDIGRWVATGMIAPLDRVLSEDTKDAIIPAALRMGMVDGQIYAAPMQMTAHTVWYYNVNHFEEAGVTAPQYWDDLFTIGNKLARYDQDGMISRYPLGIHDGPRWEGGWRNWSFLWQNGVEGVNLATGEADLTSTKAVETLEFLQRIMQENVASGGDLFGGFVSGRHSMIIEGIWTLQAFALNEDLHFDVLPVPPIPEGGQPSIQGSGWMIAMSQGASPETSRFLQSLMTPEYDQKRTTNVPPPVFRENLDVFLYSDQRGFETERQARAFGYLDFARPFPAHEYTVEMVETMGDMFARVFNGDYVVEAASQAEVKLKELMNR